MDRWTYIQRQMKQTRGASVTFYRWLINVHGCSLAVVSRQPATAKCLAAVDILPMYVGQIHGWPKFVCSKKVSSFNNSKR